jgi:hydrogenase nickel incorporation protein HypA/HybF
MHEYSLASSISKTILDNAQKHKASKVMTVNLDIGDLVCVNMDQILFWLNELFQKTIAQGAQINVNHIKPTIKCQACQYEGLIEFTEDERYHFALPKFLCTKCQSPEIKIVHGKECSIKNIEAMTDDDSSTV